MPARPVAPDRGRRQPPRETDDVAAAALSALIDAAETA
jgi:hypothetical protein